jgi:hypothetical protein
MTSANVTIYLIKDLSGNKVGEHHQNCLCKTHWGDLLKFTPPENFTITQTWFDEDEKYHEVLPVNLKVFIDMMKSSKYTRWNTMEELMKPYKDSVAKKLKELNGK